MQIQESNILTCSSGNNQIKCRLGAITRIAARLNCSTKSVSRSLKGEKGQVSNELYMAVRSIALREEEGIPYEIRRIRV